MIPCDSCRTSHVFLEYTIGFGKKKIYIYYILFHENSLAVGLLCIFVEVFIIMMTNNIIIMYRIREILLAEKLRNRRL